MGGVIATRWSPVRSPRQADACPHNGTGSFVNQVWRVPSPSIIDLPTDDLPTIDLPTIDLPTDDLPTDDLLTGSAVAVVGLLAPQGGH